MDFPVLLSFAYDRFRHLQFVRTGSEVGILRDFLSFDDPSSPLYGRSVLEITLPRFTQEQSIDFLKKGFSEIGMMVSDGLIERAVSKLDGIVGWLTAFGYRCYVQQTASEEVLESVLSQARQMIYEEIQEIIRYSENFKYVLKALAQGASTWKSIKEGAEFLSRKRMTDTSFNRLLTNLVRMGYVEKVPLNGYKLIDPIVADVARAL
ncbi:hypothetical protein A4H02_05200 [Fervidobacterium thailandense]|uniref:ATP-binding protein n=1 Tax=Fervidobacterium thailandense TaxID=1008305 RepID=A0A1E3G2B4_9BACT|nr:hypothetical protein A4H02_05200 [Fervidobacterium thailandense]